MSDEHMKDSGQGSGDDWSRISRRGWLKALFSIPVVGVFLYNYLKRKAADDAKREAIMSELRVTETGPAVIPDAISRPPGESRCRPP